MTEYDAVFLLGLKLEANGSVPDELIGRIKLAARCYHEGLSKRIIACGGKTGAQISEAQAMADLLKKYNVPEDAILLEDRSTMTYENVCNALKMIPGSRRVLLVTSDYHLFRAKVTVLREGGFWPAGRAVKTPFVRGKAGRCLVEIYALIDYLLFWGRKDEMRPAWADKLKRFLLRVHGE